MKSCVIIFASLSIVFNSGSFAQTLDWSQASGPYNSSVHSFLAVGNTIFAGVSEGGGQGLYKTTDAGKTWIIAQSGIINDISTDGKNTLFAGGSQGVTVSVDGGTIWSVRDTGFPLFAIAYAVKYINGSVYACLGDDGLFKSTDDGKSWKIPGNAVGKATYSIIESGSTLIVIEKYGTMISTNNGSTWDEPVNDLTGASVHTILKSGTMLFAGTDMGVFRSDDNGLTWSSSSIGIPSYSVISSLVFSSDGNTLFAGNTEGDLKGIYRSDDSGKTWHFLYNDMWRQSINSFFATPFGIFAGTELGIFFSSNNGDSWQNTSQGLPKVKVTSLASKGTTLLAGSANSFIFSTDDKGDHWQIHKQGLTRPNIRALFVSGNSLFAGTDAKSKEGKGGIYRSDDNGGTWNQLTGIPYIGFNTFLVHGAIFAGADSGVYSSTDNGDHWSFAGEGISDTVLTLGATSSSLLAGTKKGLYLSTNNGYSWSYELNSLGKKIVYSISTTGGNIFLATDSGVYLSIDNAHSWQLVSNSMDVRSIWTNDFVVVAGSTQGIYLSANNGSNWQSQAVSIGIPINSFSSANKQLYAATNTGMMKAPLGQYNGVSSSGKKNGLILHVTNPTDLHSLIRYRVASKGNVSISITDMIGRNEHILYQEIRDAGEYDFRWNTSEFGTGTYLIRLTSGGEVASSLVQIIH